jgi:hypothetical protein
MVAPAMVAPLSGTRVTEQEEKGMTVPIRRKEDRDDGRAGTGVEAAPGLDRAGDISREELNPDRSGSRPVEQNDRSRDGQLEEAPLP